MRYGPKYDTQTPTATHKKCSKCKRTKPAGAFNRTKSTRDGLQYYCKACKTIDSNGRRKGVRCPLCNKKYLLDQEHWYLQRGSETGYYTERCKVCIDKHRHAINTGKMHGPYGEKGKPKKPKDRDRQARIDAAHYERYWASRFRPNEG